MGKRYDHYLKHTGAGAWPARIVCVDCVSSFGRPQEGRAYEQERLQGWAAVLLRGKEGDYGPCALASGTTAADWWRWLETESRRGAYTWVLSHRAGRVWALLGLWEMIDDGVYSMARGDSGGVRMEASALQKLSDKAQERGTPVSSGAVRDMLQRADQALSYEDPPNYAGLTGRNGRVRVLWLDSRNWGIAPPESITGGECLAEWLAHATISISAAAVRLRLGALRVTVASHAYHGWRHSYYRGGVYCCAERRVLEAEGAGYNGGRCEAFILRTPKPDCWVHDIRCAYAFCAAVGRVPIRLKSYTDSPGRTDIPDSAGAARCLAHVRLRTEEPGYPLRRGDITIYPVGEYDTWLCGPELSLAVAQGRIVKWYAILTYHCEPVLREFALAAYAERCRAECEGNLAVRQWAKMIVNSLIGKLGQRAKGWRTVSEYVDIPRYGVAWAASESGVWTRYRSCAGVIQREYDDGWAEDAVPAAAGWITSMGRCRLLEGIRAAGWQQTLYCDTDSVVVSGVGDYALSLAGLVKTGELGHFEPRAGPVTVIVHGIKYYSINGLVTCAGQPKGHNSATTDPGLYWHHLTPAEQIRNRQVPGAVRSVRHYARHLEYRHGEVLADGRVIPWRLT